MYTLMNLEVVKEVDELSSGESSRLADEGSKLLLRKRGSILHTSEVSLVLLELAVPRQNRFEFGEDVNLC